MCSWEAELHRTRLGEWRDIWRMLLCTSWRVGIPIERDEDGHYTVATMIIHCLHRVHSPGPTGSEQRHDSARFTGEGKGHAIPIRRIIRRGHTTRDPIARRSCTSIYIRGVYESSRQVAAGGGEGGGASCCADACASWCCCCCFLVRSIAGLVGGQQGSLRYLETRVHFHEMVFASSSPLRTVTSCLHTTGTCPHVLHGTLFVSWETADAIHTRILRLQASEHQR